MVILFEIYRFLIFVINKIIVWPNRLKLGSIPDQPFQQQRIKLDMLFY